MSLLSRNSPWLVVFILFAVPLGPMATDVFTPSLPAIQKAFSAAPTCVVVFFSSFISSHCMATGIAMFTRNTGTAVALMSCLLISLSVIVAFSFSFIHVSSQKPLAVVFVLLSLSALVASILEKKAQSATTV